MSATQVLPATQAFFAGSPLPPQSTSVSVPFFTPSVYEAGWQVSGVPEQTLSVQSLAAPHPFPSAQRGQAGPPQSTSVSVPFFAPSLHITAAQIAFRQTSLAQSAGPPHPCPCGQVGAPMPPQSMPVSVPFFTPSVVDGGWHRGPCPTFLHTSLWQSVPATQAFNVSHGAQLPPQSMSVSLPFFAPSVQPGAAHSLVGRQRCETAQSLLRVQAIAASAPEPESLDELQAGTPKAAAATKAKAERKRRFMKGIPRSSRAYAHFT